MEFDVTTSCGPAASTTICFYRSTRETSDDVLARPPGVTKTNEDNPGRYWVITEP
jgi:hypothetical protein